MLGIRTSKWYTWKERKGIDNNPAPNAPSYHAILPQEQEAIIVYCRDKRMLGYRRLSYMMIDADVAYVSPASVYRILKAAGLLNIWVKTEPNKTGEGYIQPQAIHEDWHNDIAYVNILGTFFFLITVLDGYSRMVLHHEVRAHMQEVDVEIVLRRTQEKNPDAKAKLITDNGSQYTSTDFKQYMKESGLRHIRTSVAHPQSNGKIERFHRTIKDECIRKTPMTSIEQARRVISESIRAYNEERLHSGIWYLTPKEVVEGKKEQRLAERREKLDTARIKRQRIAGNIPLESPYFNSADSPFLAEA